MPTTYNYNRTNNQVTIGWTASPGATGYRLYYGVSSGVYTTNIDVGNVTQYTLSGVFLVNTKYYFALTAYNALGQESSFSSEVFDTPYSSMVIQVAAVTSRTSVPHSYIGNVPAIFQIASIYTFTPNPPNPRTFNYIGSVSMVMSASASKSFRPSGATTFTPSTIVNLTFGVGADYIFTKNYPGNVGMSMGIAADYSKSLLADTTNINQHFRIYKRDCEVRVKEHGTDMAYAITNPFGGPSHDEPSGAEI